MKRGLLGLCLVMALAAPWAMADEAKGLTQAGRHLRMLAMSPCPFRAQAPSPLTTRPKRRPASTSREKSAPFPTSLIRPGLRPGS